ncbi:unnamed protein product, partial [Soboliphyme baturini]|uniref:Usp domain-containing protein n=1 Tax=Soboliphyme baturini TaxID=241478 RepID=A0A183JAP8_9BILA
MWVRREYVRRGTSSDLIICFLGRVMDVHQIITGALNKGADVFAVGSIHGLNFTACAVGCDIVILSSDFHRVQVIS